MEDNKQQSTEGEVSLESFFDMTPEIVEQEKEVTTEEVVIEDKTTETKTEDKEPAVVEEKVVEEQKPQTTTSNKVFDKLQILIDNGVIEDTRVVLTDNEDDEGVLISEFKDITQEQLDDIKSQQKALKDQELQDKYISKEGLNDNHLKIVKFLKDGGDLKEVFENPEQAFKTPYEGLDLTDVKTQQAIALRDYIQNKGLSQADAMLVVAQKQKNFELDSLVTSIVEQDINAHNERINNMAQTQEEKRKEKEESIKATRKALTSTFKENKFKEGITKKVVDSVTKFSKNGNSIIEDTFKELLKEPEKNYLTLLHIVDPEAFNELHKIQESKKVTGAVLRLKDKTVTTRTNKIKDQQEEKVLSDLEELFADVGPVTK